MNNSFQCKSAETFICVMETGMRQTVQFGAGNCGPGETKKASPLKCKGGVEPINEQKFAI